MEFEFLIKLWENPFVKKTVIVVLTLLFYLVVITLGNFIIKKILTRIADKTADMESKKQVSTVRTVTVSIVDTILVAVMCFEILNAIGIDIRPFLAAAGVVGVALGFGAKNFVEDIIMGFTILLSGQVRVGDFVEIGTSSGIVQKINIRMIILRDLQGSVHFIRNGLVDKVINHTKDYSYALFNFDVAYKEDIRHVMEVLKELGANMRQDKAFKKKIIGDIEVMGLDSFENSSIKIKCRIKTLPAFHWEVFRTFNLLVKEKFDELGIEIPFTQITVNQPQM